MEALSKSPQPAWVVAAVDGRKKLVQVASSSSTSSFSSSSKAVLAVVVVVLAIDSVIAITDTFAGRCGPSFCSGQGFTF